MISTLMMIYIMNNEPFQDKNQQVIETASEFIIILTLYHVVLLSDFVPAAYSKFREGTGYSMVILISLTTLYFLFIIVKGIAISVYISIRRKRAIAKFQKVKKELI